MHTPAAEFCLEHVDGFVEVHLVAVEAVEIIAQGAVLRVHTVELRLPRGRVVKLLSRAVKGRNLQRQSGKAQVKKHKLRGGG